jgi:hypothetical protein
MGLVPAVWSQSHQPVETLQEHWDPSQQQWTPHQRTSFNYCANGALRATRRQEWDNQSQTWLPGQALQRTYDESGQLLQQQLPDLRVHHPLPQWNHNAAAPEEASLYQDYARDEQGRIRYLRTRAPHGPQGELMTVDSQSYRYDPMVGPEPQQVLRYVASAGHPLHWVETTRYTYIYDQSGRLVYQRDEQQQADEPQWTRQAEYYYSYDASLRQTRAIAVQHGPLYTATQERITYDPAGRIQAKWQAVRHDPTTAWQPIFEQTYAYDDQGRHQRKVVHSQWVEAAQGWSQRYEQRVVRHEDGKLRQVSEVYSRQDPAGDPDRRQITAQTEGSYAYDLSGRLTSYIRRQLIGDAQTPDVRVRHTYERPSPQDLVLRLYPNPASEHLTVGWPQSQWVEGTLRVRDVTGRELWQTKAGFSQEMPFHVPLGGWQAGYYLLEFQRGDQQFYATFVKR